MCASCCFERERTYLSAAVVPKASPAISRMWGIVCCSQPAFSDYGDHAKFPGLFGFFSACDCSNATRCPDRPFPGSVLNASDEDEKLVEKVAREIVEQHGDDSVEIVNERAEAAGLLAHELAAETWRDIATAAERMFRESRGSLVF
jgi:hypothetical protein